MSSVAMGAEVGFVALLGFLSPFQGRGRYEGRVLNVHPALVPAFSGKGFYGRRVHDTCYRRAYYDAGLFVESWDDQGAQKGFEPQKRCHRPDLIDGCNQCCGIPLR